jgi:hypothetical protein
MASSPDELDEQTFLITKNWRIAIFGYWRSCSYMRIPHADSGSCRALPLIT